ncbi:4468_t:CDS:1, partial [Cetraspora pellucida]
KQKKNNFKEFFDISHPDFDQHQAIENLQSNFQGTVRFCENCLHAKTKVELEQYNQYCQECYEEAHSPEPEQAPSVMTSSSTQTSDDSKQII